VDGDQLDHSSRADCLRRIPQSHTECEEGDTRPRRNPPIDLVDNTQLFPPRPSGSRIETVNVLVLVNGLEVLRQSRIVVDRRLCSDFIKGRFVLLLALEECHDGQSWWLGLGELLLAKDLFAEGVEIIRGGIAGVWDFCRFDIFVNVCRGFFGRHPYDYS
jgi:hypothetical protein